MKKSNKENVETIVLENSKTGETLELQHEQHKAEYGAKHFWKADKKFFELLSTFSAAESKVLAYILQKTQPTKNEFIGAYLGLIVWHGIGCVQQVMERKSQQDSELQNISRRNGLVA